MKAFNTIVKILATLAAIAGAIYVIATYGDKIVAWAKKLWATLPQCGDAEFVPASELVQEPASEETVQEEAVPDAAPEETAQEIPVEEAAPAIPENEPVADEADFAE